MATDQEYAAATAAVMADVNAEIAADVPTMFRSAVPTDKLAAFAAKTAKDAVDAAEKVRVASTTQGPARD
jgi:hypothetical protein